MVNRLARKIAEKLNDSAVLTPDGGKGFDSSTIHSILANETYRGLMIYNRQKFFRNPDGGKKRRLNPRSERHIHEKPEVRIIDDDLWEKVRARFEKPKTNKATTAHRVCSYPFTGLVHCALCGAKFTACKTIRKGHTYIKYRSGYNRRRGASICKND